MQYLVDTCKLHLYCLCGVYFFADWIDAVSSDDKEGKFTVSDPKDKARQNQYLYFQSSGQGPYFGQAAHFSMFAPEKIEYGINRYKNEVKRVFTVLENVLSESGDWLIGNKCTIADLAFYVSHDNKATILLCAKLILHILF